MENESCHPISYGSIVRLKESFCGEPVQTRAFVYDIFSLGEGRWNGISLITENGVDLGGFSEREQVDCLQHVCKTDFRYRFRNVMQLGEDFNNGVFNSVFNLKLSNA